MTMASSPAQGIAWDLSDLFEQPGDPAIAQAFEQLNSDITAFAAHYRGRINTSSGPDPEELREALESYQGLQNRLIRVSTYAELLFSADTSSSAARELLALTEERMTQLGNQLLFFDLEWTELSDELAEAALQHPALQPFRYYLARQRKFKPHRLSEAEERILNERDLTGVQAWQNLFTELTGSLQFDFQHDGSTRQLTLSEVLTLQRDHQRSTRQQAHESLYQTLQRNGQLLSFLYNTRVQDALVLTRLRNFADPMHSRHLDNDIAPDVIETMIGVTEQHYELAQRYFTHKARLLGLEQLELYDQYAPIRSSKSEISYEQSRQLINEALGRFDQTVRELADEFFARNWIDAEVRPGKRGGAFCAPVVPDLHPYVLVNYTGDLRDVMTVAHELGHGLHFRLSSEQNLLNYYCTLPLAETASVFAEMLVFEYLLEHAPDLETQQALLCSKIEDIFATIFRQNVLTRFEQAAFAARSQGRLSAEQIGAAWLQANQAYYGDAVRLTPGYEWGWSYIPHFINTPFYCYAYVFGELLVLSLYSMYKDQGSAFVPQYVELLRSGGSKSPAELLAPLGIDLHDSNFWRRGFVELERLIARVEALANPA